MIKYIVLLLLASLAVAQTKPPESLFPGETIYEFKNVSTDRMMAIVGFVRSLLRGNVQIEPDINFKTAIIQQGANEKTTELVDKAVELFKRYDVPPAPVPAAPQVDFVAYLVQASGRGPGEAAPPGQPIPAVLQDAVTEMKKTFSYTDYTLLDTLASDVRHNTVISNMLPGRQTHGVPYFYEIRYDNVSVSSDRKTISVDPFQFHVRIPVQSGTAEYQNAGISTYVGIREGEKLVIGKVRTGVNDTSDIFLVLTAKLR
jgi:hypothetical protein